MREHLRHGVYAIWMVLALVVAWNNVIEEAGTFSAPPDFVTRMIEELQPLDGRLPRNQPVLFVGDEEAAECIPAWVARNALAPRLVLDREGEEHARWLAGQGIGARPSPHIVLVWGEIDEGWGESHPDIRVLYRASEHAHVGWRR